jgi:hypothetical protein
MKKIVLCAAIALVLLVPMSAQEREQRISAGLAEFLNLVPGFGLGSFLQHDACGGVTELLVEGFGVGTLIAFYLEPSEDAFPNMVGGLVLLTGGFAYGLLRPFFYARTLARRGNTVVMNISPAIAPSAGRRKFDIAIGLRLRLDLE